MVQSAVSTARVPQRVVHMVYERHQWEDLVLDTQLAIQQHGQFGDLVLTLYVSHMWILGHDSSFLDHLPADAREDARQAMLTAYDTLSRHTHRLTRDQCRIIALAETQVHCLREAKPPIAVE